MNNLGQGIAIMIMGLGITFTALGLFIGLILLLEYLFPPKPKTEMAAEEFQTRSAVSHLKRDTTDEEIAAAIAIALAHLYSYELCRSNLGVDLEKGRSPWWVGGRLNQIPLGSLSIRGRN